MSSRTMAPNLVQVSTVTHSPFQLNVEGTPRVGAQDSASDIEQLPLSPQMDWAQKGARIRALLNKALVSSGITMPEIERNTGVDEKQAARNLKEGGGNHPPLPLVAYLLWSDERAVILGGLASMLGYELRRREPDLAAENRSLRARLARLEAVLRGDEP